MSENASSSRTPWLTILAVLGGFAIFIFIVNLAYVPKQPAPLGDGVRTPEQRYAILSELRAKEKQAATTYDWVDQPKGIVRLPIERAAELTIQELNTRK